MKFEYRKNKNGTVDIMYKRNDITINLHGTAQEVETAYNNMRNSYIGDDIPVYSELIQYKFKNYEYEIPDNVEESEESDDEHIKICREVCGSEMSIDNQDVCNEKCSECQIRKRYSSCEECERNKME